LELKVAQILRECGYEVEVQKQIALARGDVNVDVWADDHSEPANVLVIECKHWASAVTKNVVHAFRMVVGESGANTGLIVSTAGYQDGAKEAAAYSNVRLLTWDDFQQMFAWRWFRTYMSTTISDETDALHEYTEPINNRVFRKADALPERRRSRFSELRKTYFPLAVANFSFHPVMLNPPGPRTKSTITGLQLPLRTSYRRLDGGTYEGLLPDEVLDATALRPLMDELLGASRRAIAEFDAVFGERA
jgi:hypothetical protein